MPKNQNQKKEGSSKNKEFIDQEYEAKRQQYFEYLKEHPPIINENTGQEMKECEGCYCQLLTNSSYDFCGGCLGCKNRGCKFGCCDCFSDGTRGWRNSEGKITKGSHQGKQKKLTDFQAKRFELEAKKWKLDWKIEEVKHQEEPDGDLWVIKRLESVRRWNEQEKQQILKNLSIEELQEALEQRKSKSVK